MASPTWARALAWVPVKLPLCWNPRPVSQSHPCPFAGMCEWEPRTLASSGGPISPGRGPIPEMVSSGSLQRG
ncbi:hypothetical protein N7468_003477 [Penicillium chermesinum]|uniref:Uncharacterized protein n=1 Tax=Penicillium chermesinum TaxID=63820 RepID=A0A9W9P947_9EURO|nr:uncharacterized protein N7468_003477 [Penicillium chermesinum]KAJ5238858.1 hypothetical protein N7468_003477 [Penicillium chermesinum]